jgi:cytoskeletal protein CcmA (bactofilin family)
MFKRSDKLADGQVDTLIGKATSVQGDVEFSGGLHIDGRVTGSVRATAGVPAALSVSEHGVIDGSVEAPSVVLNGRVNGDIFGRERVILGAKARVQGNVHYSVIEMALGAEISGRLVPSGSALPGAPPSALPGATKVPSVGEDPA